MKHIYVFILILAIVALANQFYVLGASVALFLVCIILWAFKRAKKILNMYLGMPTVWQNVQETLEIGLTFEIIGEAVTVYRIWIFYSIMEAHAGFFEIRVNEDRVSSFELKYGKSSSLKNQPTRNRALYYFVEAVKSNPERLPEIINAVQVRKKVRGKKQDPEKEVSMDLQPMYIT